MSSAIRGLIGLAVAALAALATIVLAVFAASRDGTAACINYVMGVSGGRIGQFYPGVLP